MLDKVWAQLDKALTEGISLSQFKAAVKDELLKHGWLSPDDLTETGRLPTPGRAAAGHHLPQQHQHGLLGRALCPADRPGHPGRLPPVAVRGGCGRPDPARPRGHERPGLPGRRPHLGQVVSAQRPQLPVRRHGPHRAPGRKAEAPGRGFPEDGHRRIPCPRSGLGHEPGQGGIRRPCG